MYKKYYRSFNKYRLLLTFYLTLIFRRYNGKKDSLFYNILDIYYREKNVEMPSERSLALMFNSTRGRVGKVLDYLKQGGYIYMSKRNKWLKDEVKHNYSNNFQFDMKDEYFSVKCIDYDALIMFDEFKKISDKFNIDIFTQINDIQTFLFLFFELHGTYVSSTKIIYKFKDGKMWNNKECYVRNYEQPLYKTEYTQGNEYLVFGNNK